MNTRNAPVLMRPAASRLPATGAPRPTTTRAGRGSARSPPMPRKVKAVSPPTASSGVMPVADSIRYCTAAPAAAPPGTTRVTAFPDNWAVTTGPHARVRSARR